MINWNNLWSIVIVFGALPKLRKWGLFVVLDTCYIGCAGAAVEWK